MGPSSYIRARQTREIKRAVRHAWRIGKPMTRWVIINFDLPLVGDEFKPQRQFCAIRKKAWTWWNHHRKTGRAKGAFSDCRIWENPSGLLHANWLIHVPDHLVDEFQAKMPKWVIKVLTKIEAQDLYESKIPNVNGLLKYTLKGTDPEKAERFGIRHVDQGEVWGRRAVASMNLGKAARHQDWQSGNVIERTWKYRKPSAYAE